MKLALKSCLLLITLMIINTTVIGQKPKQLAPGEIYESIKKLNVLANALYVAAHPDDENQRLISYLANDVKANTTYLSLTRGDGGQNIVGTEIKEELGIIRTQELLAARRVDGGQQTFSRAVDFGFSKHPDETLRIWNKDEVLSDVVWAIRKYRPDVIINRFDHRTPGKTHGHHTSSAMLSFEAFDLSNDPKQFPDQLQYANTWQASRLFFNTSWWFYGGRDKFKEADKSNLISIDKGVYYPALGQSNTEIAAVARSQHRSQGFGNTGVRGSEQEYLEYLKGQPIESKGDIFDGIDISWNRVAQSDGIEEMVNGILASFDISDPSASVYDLLELYERIEKLDDQFWKTKKINELEEIIFQCMGLYLEAVSSKEIVALQSETEVAIEVINRSGMPATLLSYELLPDGVDTTLQLALDGNQKYTFYHDLDINAYEHNGPYWLKKTPEYGMHTVTDQQSRGVPEMISPYRVEFKLKIQDRVFDIVKPIVYKENDRVKAEIYKPFHVVPPVSAKLDKEVYIYKDESAQILNVQLTSYQADQAGTVKVDLPQGWQVKPATLAFELTRVGEEAELSFELTPPKGESLGTISPIVMMDDKEYSDQINVIEYEYIPQQIAVKQAQARVVKTKVQTAGERIGYIMGAGDKVPDAIRELGYTCDLIPVADINPALLSQYSTVVIGIRAYNTEKTLKLKQPYLFDYVKNGGTLVTQYMTTWGLDVDEVGPYPLKISRDRVTDETAPVRLADPDHPVLNEPNKITKQDFEGWVQERGLYFANDWDERYATPIGSQDPGESEKLGSLLIADYGDGQFVYTGISWFRLLPAGVPGAFKLFANILSLGHVE